MSDPGRDLALEAPADAITAVAFHPSDPERLLCSAWDGTIHLYNSTSSSDPSTTRVFTPSRAPAFDVCWGASGSSKIYSGGLDRNVVETDTESSSYRIIGTHDDAVRCVRYIESANCVVSASWDKTLRIHSLSTGTPTSVTLPLPAKAFSMDLTGDKLVVAMAQRHVYIYNISSFANPSESIEPYQKRENSLKFMVRSVKSMPTGAGYACSSIEGRVAVEYFDMDEKTQKGHFAFKCHRQLVDNVDTVYPVNALAFHPQHGTFATGGGDSVVAIWDPAAKKRLRQLPKYPASIAGLSFNADGSKLAIACSVIEEEQPPAPGARNALFVRRVEDECKPKPKV